MFLSVTDALTGLGNRWQFDRRLREEIARARREETPLSLIITNVDRFKRVNDAYGYRAADRVLRTLAGVLRAAFRETDVLCRCGGDVFAVIAPQTTLSAARLLAERSREQVSATLMPTPWPALRITLSIGASSWRATDGTRDLEVVRRAGDSLYLARREGRTDEPVTQCQNW